VKHVDGVTFAGTTGNAKVPGQLKYVSLFQGPLLPILSQPLLSLEHLEITDSTRTGGGACQTLLNDRLGGFTHLEAQAANGREVWMNSGKTAVIASSHS
jgi:hypothetical protein